MSIATASVLAVLVYATAFLSGIFGMAGGMILMGALLFVLPVSAAMVLHAIAQMAANGWRALLWRRYSDTRIAARFVGGSLVALALFSLILFVPDRATVLIALGLMPLIALVLPERIAPRIEHRFAAEGSGFLCTSLQLLSGVSGPALDIFFVRSPMDRRTVVATKATCQVFSHSIKLVYFGSIASTGDPGLGWGVLAGTIVLAVLGTTSSRAVLERLTDNQFRRWTRRIVLTIGLIYLAQGVSLHLGLA